MASFHRAKAFSPTQAANIAPGWIGATSRAAEGVREASLAEHRAPKIQLPKLSEDGVFLVARRKQRHHQESNLRTLFHFKHLESSRA
jgi:hypothetical protein